MNPFSQSLLKQIKDRQLAEFVARGDRLEALVVRVNKAGAATGADEAEYAGLRRWLRRRYGQWEARLRSYWPGIRAGGEPLLQDPFLSLLALERATALADNWTAMQLLPAARESINMMLVDKLNGDHRA